MPAIFDVESTLTDRYQTTVPEAVRRALHLGKRDTIHYSIGAGGEVVRTHADVKFRITVPELHRPEAQVDDAR